MGRPWSHSLPCSVPVSLLPLVRQEEVVEVFECLCRVFRFQTGLTPPPLPSAYHACLLPPGGGGG
jgi:hypothetical protein